MPPCATARAGRWPSQSRPDTVPVLKLATLCSGTYPEVCGRAWGSSGVSPGLNTNSHVQVGTMLPEGPGPGEVLKEVEQVLQRKSCVTSRVSTRHSPVPCFLSTGGPGEPFPWPGCGFPAANLLDVTVPSGLALQQH